MDNRARSALARSPLHRVTLGVCVIGVGIYFLGVARKEFQKESTILLGDTSPFFPEILLSRKPSEPQEKQRSVFEKNDGRNDWNRNQPLEFFWLPPFCGTRRASSRS